MHNTLEYLRLISAWLREQKERNEKIGLLPSAVLFAVVMAFVGLIAGIMYSFGGAIYDVLVSANAISSNSTPGVSYGTALAFLAILGMPAMFGAFGFALGIVGAVVYNVVSGWIFRPRGT